MTPAGQLDNQAKAAVVKILEEPAWGDTGFAVEYLERALRDLLEATATDLERWERDGPALGLDCERSVSPRELAVMDPSWKLAWIAQMLESFRWMYGLQDPASHRVDPRSPGGLLRALRDVAYASVDRQQGPGT